jgi:hypothetical protein
MGTFRTVKQSHRVVIFENAQLAQKAASVIWHLYPLSGQRLSEMTKFALYALCKLVVEYPYGGVPPRHYLWVYLIKDLQSIAEQFMGMPEARGIDPQYKCEYADLVASLSPPLTTKNYTTTTP